MEKIDMSKKSNLEKLTKGFPEIDGLKKLFTYSQSAENQKGCQPFEELNQKYISLQKQYVNSFHELSKDIVFMIYRREYAKGGEGFHRGVHSPSVMDLVVGNYNRGRLLKNPQKEKNYNYEYLFDAQNNLICVYNYSNFDGASKLISTELFVRQQNKTLSLLFDSDNEHGLSFMSECQYENALFEMSYDSKDCTEINVETYEYENDLMQSFSWYRYAPSIQLLDQYKYTFTRNEEGYLFTYTVEQLGGFKPEAQFDREPVIYEVRKKRK